MDVGSSRRPHHDTSGSDSDMSTGSSSGLGGGQGGRTDGGLGLGLSSDSDSDSDSGSDLDLDSDADLSDGAPTSGAVRGSGGAEALALAQAQGDSSDAEEAQGDGDTSDSSDAEGEPSEHALKYLECTMFPRTAPDAFRDAIQNLNSNHFSAMVACGGTFEMMLETFDACYDYLVEDLHSAMTPWDKYEAACHMFGLEVNVVAPPKLVKKRVERTLIPIVKIQLTIDRDLDTQHAILSNSMNHDTPEGADDCLQSAAQRRRLRDSIRRKCMRMLTIMDQAQQLLCFMTMNYAGASPECTVRPPWPRLAHAYMDKDTESKPLTDQQVVERALFHSLFLDDMKRCGDMVMRPRTITRGDGQTITTHSYEAFKTIAEYIEYETAISKNQGLWRRRGQTKYLEENLKKADTYLFKPLEPKQGVIATSDFLIDMNERKFYAHMLDDPRVHELRELALDAACKLEEEVRTHKNDITIEAPQRAIAMKYVTLMREVVARRGAREGEEGAEDSDEEAAAAVRVPELAIEMQQALREAEEDCLNDERAEIMADATMTPAEKRQELQELREQATQFRVATLVDAQEVLLVAEERYQEHRTFIKRMQREAAVLRAMFPTTAPHDGLVAEIFVENEFPWDMMRDYLVPERCVEKSSHAHRASHTPGYLRLEWRKFQAPHFNRILVDQQLPQGAIDFFYVMLGRQIFEHSKFEKWQVVFEVMGWSNTGKSLICNVFEALHCERGKRVNRTGKLSNNIEPMFGPAEVLGGEKKENRKFAVVHPDLQAQFCKNFPLGVFMSWAASEETSYAIKFKSPIVVGAPHTAFFTNPGLQYKNDEYDAANRRRLAVRFLIAITKPNSMLETQIMDEDFLALYLRGGLAYWEVTHDYPGVGIWTARKDGGFLPQYYFQMRNLNRLASQPLLAFLQSSKGDTLEFGDEKFMSMKMLKQLTNQFTDNNTAYTRVDWSNDTGVRQILSKFDCRIVVPAQCAPGDLPAGLQGSNRRGQWLVGVTEFAPVGDGGGGGGGGGGMPGYAAAGPPTQLGQGGGGQPGGQPGGPAGAAGAAGGAGAPAGGAVFSGAFM